MGFQLVTNLEYKKFLISSKSWKIVQILTIDDKF